MARTTRVVILFASVLTIVTGLASPATAAVGAPATGASDAPAVSGDGRWVAFISKAGDLLADPGVDTNGVEDVYLLDTQTDAVTLVSRNPQSGAVGNGASDEVAVSNDGRYVGFVSEATNLLAADGNGSTSDILLFDRIAGTLTLVSRRGTEGPQGNAPSFDVSITRDGTKVAFTSAASNLVSGDTNGAADAFVRDLVAGTTTRVSTSSSGKQANGSTFSTGISGNGAFVGFDSSGSTLINRDDNGVRDVFLKNLTNDKTIRISVSSKEREGNDDSFFTGLSTTGRDIVFTSDATNLIGTDTNRASDVFVRDKTEGTTTRVSRRGSTEANGASGGGAVSPDGAFVAFTTAATNLGGGVADGNDQSDLFEYEVATGTLRLVAVDTGGGWANGASFGAAYGPTSVLSFASSASDLVGDDTNGVADVFTRSWATGRDGGTTVLRSRKAA